MDSVYDAAKTRADKLKAELEALQTFLTLHDHFRDHFGLTSPAETSAAPSEVEAPILDHVESAPDIDLQEPEVEAAASSEAPAPPAAKSQAPEPDAVEDDAAEASVVEQDAPPSSVAKAPVTVSSEAAPEVETRVIKASEGVLIAAPVEPEAVAPLGPEATLQSVAEKLAATIAVTNPSVTGYTV
jgi:hypothetical protein